jgi:hypothetical protein
MLTPEMIEGARALRVKNRKRWPFVKLAQRFGCSRQEMDNALRANGRLKDNSPWGRMTSDERCRFIEAEATAGSDRGEMAAKVGCTSNSIREFAKTQGVRLTRTEVTHRQWSHVKGEPAREWIVGPGQTNPWAVQG